MPAVDVISFDTEMAASYGKSAADLPKISTIVQFEASSSEAN